MTFAPKCTSKQTSWLQNTSTNVMKERFYVLIWTFTYVCLCSYFYYTQTLIFALRYLRSDCL